MWSRLKTEFTVATVDGEYVEFVINGVTYRLTARDNPAGVGEFQAGDFQTSVDSFHAALGALAIPGGWTPVKYSSISSYLTNDYNGYETNIMGLVSTMAPQNRVRAGVYYNFALNNYNNGQGIIQLTQSDNQCFGVSTGQISLVLFGVSNPQYRHVDDANWQNMVQNVSPYEANNLRAGLYYVRVTYGSQVQDPVEFLITDPESPVEVDVTVNDVLCNGTPTGSILLNVSGGVPPYIYEWSNGEVTKDILNLVAGNYTGSVTDQNGCKTLIDETVTEPEPIAIESTVVGDSITLVVEGGTPGYDYLWNTGAITKDLNGLVPGDYSVLVTDQNGCTAQALITIADFQYYYSQNPIPLELTAGDPETKVNLSFVNQVWVEETYLSDVYTQLAKEEHPADSDGSTVFQGESYLDAFLQAYIPDPDLDAVVLADGMFKRFYYRHNERFGDPPSDSNITQVDTRFVMLGGLNDIEYAADNFFGNYVPSVKPFLNWETAEKYVLPEQPDYLYYVVNSFNQTEMRVKVKIYWEDGGFQVLQKYVNNGITNRFEVWCIPVGYAQLGLDVVDANRVVQYYEVWVENQDGIRSSEIRRYNLDWDYFPYQRYLLYQSSLGGMCTLALTGKAVKSIDMDRETTEKYLGHSFNITDLSEKIVFSSGKPMISFNSGYITHEEYFERLEDFAQSDEYYLLQDTPLAGKRWVPVNVRVSKLNPYDETRQDALNVISGTIYLPKQSRYTPEL